MLVIRYEFLLFLISGRAGEHLQVKPVSFGDALVLAAHRLFGLEENSCNSPLELHEALGQVSWADGCGTDHGISLFAKYGYFNIAKRRGAS